MSATTKVFAIAELVEVIFLNLDEISLVRVQRVNSFCRGVVSGSTRLKRRLGILDAYDEVSDNTAHPLPQGDDCVRWNPLLDWFSMRCFGSSVYSRSFNKSCGLEITTFLPHAFHAAQSRELGIYNMAVTLPPVKEMIMVLPQARRIYQRDRFNRKRFTLSMDRGVTIGDVLRTWAETTLPEAQDQMVWLQVCSAKTREVPRPSYVIEWADSFLDDEAWAMQDRIHDLCQEVKKCPSHSKLDNTLIAHDLRVLQCWAKRMEGTAPAWHNAPKDKQDSVVTAFFNAYKRIWKELMCEAAGDGNVKTFWPALAMPAKKRDGLELMWKPYEVDYASGLVFNRQEVDPKYIRLPFK